MDLPDTAVKELEHLRHHSFSPDVDDLVARLARTMARRRRAARATGLAGTLLVIAITASGIRLVGRDHAPPIASPIPQVAGSLQTGKLLLQTGENVGVLQADETKASPIGLSTAYGFSPDGTEILAVSEPAPLRSGSLIGINLISGARRVLVKARLSETLGPAAWSPDGSQIAFGRETFRPATDHIKRNQLCVITLEDAHTTCLDQEDLVSSFSWDPSGSAIAVQQTGDRGILSWDPSSGAVANLVAPGGGEALNAALQAKGLGPVHAVTDPSWSPSGRYLAVEVQSIPGGSVPIILARDGSVAAMGSANDDSQIMTWQPTADLLAYTTGKFYPAAGSGVETTAPGQQSPTVLLSEAGLADPWIQSLAWSPNGDLLAVDHAHGPIQLVPVTAQGKVTTVHVRGLLIDWGP